MGILSFLFGDKGEGGNYCKDEKAHFVIQTKPEQLAKPVSKVRKPVKPKAEKSIATPDVKEPAIEEPIAQPVKETPAFQVVKKEPEPKVVMPEPEPEEKTQGGMMQCGFTVVGMRYMKNFFHVMLTTKVGDTITVREEPNIRHKPQLAAYNSMNEKIGYVAQSEHEMSNRWMKNGCMRGRVTYVSETRIEIIVEKYVNTL